MEKIIECQRIKESDDAYDKEFLEPIGIFATTQLFELCNAFDVINGEIQFYHF